MNINPLTFKMSYANFRGRAQNSIYNGIYAPVSYGDFLLSDFNFGGVENTTGASRIISRDYRHVLSPRSLAGLGNFSKKVYNMKELISYTFKNTQIRTTVIEGEPWFVATDVARALEYSDSARAARYLDDDEKDVFNWHTLGGDQQLTIINESGLYSLILRSRKPEAKAFKKFVTAEVLPAIRRQGYYGTPDKEVMKSLGGMVKSCCAAAMRTEFEKIATDMVYGEKFKALIREALKVTPDNDFKFGVWKDIIAASLAARCENMVKEKEKDLRRYSPE